MRCASAGARHTGGFTLLETLAAVVMMLLFYGVLSAQGLIGFELEGDAERRLEASLVADRQLAAIEAALAAGEAPPAGTREDSDGGYDVRIDVAPLALPWADAGDDAGDASRRERDAAPSLLAAAGPGAAPILSVLVTVAWDDGRPRSVRRTTFALDSEAVAAALDASGVRGATDAQGNPIFPGADTGVDDGAEGRR